MSKPRSRKAHGKPSKPMTAAERRAKDFERVQLQPDAAALQANADVQVERAERPDAAEGKRGNVERARRMDAFEALRPSMAKIAGAYDAARKLERDILIRRGEHDRGRPLDRTDGERYDVDRLDAMIAAGQRVDRALGLIGERDVRLLVELITPTGPATLDAEGWRGVVQYVTGETTPHGQCAAVRSACANLAQAYERSDKLPRKAA